MEILIHIGMPKTGTTSIQNALYSNRNLLLKEGVLIPETGRFNQQDEAHHAFFYALTYKKQVIKTPFNPATCKSFEYYIDELKKEIAKHKPKLTILTSEMVWNPVAFNEECLKKLKEHLPNHHIKILVFLRDIDKHTTSMFAQRVSGPQKFSGTIYDHITEFMDMKMWDYRDRLDTLGKIFGHESVEVHWYDDHKESVISILQSYVEHPILQNYEKRLNVRKSWLSISILNILNKISNRSIFWLGIKRGLVYILNRALNNIKFIDKMFYPLSKRVLDQLQEKNKIEKLKVKLYYSSNT
jgi:hypothetical protein